MAEPYPSRLLDRFVLRMPDGLRERLSEAAKANGRSMNAEMIQALEAWLAPHAGSDEPNPQRGPLPGDRVQLGTLHVLLDTNGLPISWHEVHEHLKAITKDAHLSIDHMEMHVLTPAHVASDQRAREVEALAKGYRKLFLEQKRAERA